MPSILHLSGLRAIVPPSGRAAKVCSGSRALYLELSTSAGSEAETAKCGNRAACRPNRATSPDEIRGADNTVSSDPASGMNRSQGEEWLFPLLG